MHYLLLHCMCILSSLHSKVFTSNLSWESWYKIPASQSWCSWKQIIIRLAVCTLLWSIHNKPIHILDRFYKNTSHLKCYIPHLCHTRLTLWELKLLCFSSHHIRLSGRFSTICVASSKMKHLSDQWPIVVETFSGYLATAFLEMDPKLLC